MASKHKFTIEIPAATDLEALSKLNALSTIAENISAENLKVLAEKSKTFGINAKIQAFKNYI